MVHCCWLEMFHTTSSDAVSVKGWSAVRLHCRQSQPVLFKPLNVVTEFKCRSQLQPQVLHHHLTLQQEQSVSVYLLKQTTEPCELTSISGSVTIHSASVALATSRSALNSRASWTPQRGVPGLGGRHLWWTERPPQHSSRTGPCRQGACSRPSPASDCRLVVWRGTDRV